METVSGIIFDIKKYSIHDGPGIRTTVFFKGCPLQCWWCHNPESQSAVPELIIRRQRCIQCGVCMEVCPEGANLGTGNNVPRNGIARQKCRVCGRCVETCYSGTRELVGKRVTVSEVIHDIERDRPFYEQSAGGVTLSGGEPLMQPRFMLALLHACKELDLHTVLDTSGYATWGVLEKTIPLVNMYLYDLKIMDESRHREVTGVTNGLILRNLRRLAESGAKLDVRIPLVPGINDDEVSLRLAGEYLASLVNPPEVEIMPYHDIAEAKYESLGKTYRLPDLTPPVHENVAWAIEILKSYELQVSSQSVTQPSAVEMIYDGQ